MNSTPTPDSAPKAGSRSRRLRRILGILLLVGGLLTLWVYQARDVYTWHRGEIANAERGGWRVLKTFDNHSDLALPWTIIWPPITRVEFLADTSELNVQNWDEGTILLTRSSRIDFEQRVTRSVWAYFIDHEDDRFTFIHPDDLKGLDALANEKWFKMSEHPELQFLFDAARE